jgi:hypothetical protein
MLSELLLRDLVLDDRLDEQLRSRAVLELLGGPDAGQERGAVARRHLALLDELAEHAGDALHPGARQLRRRVGEHDVQPGLRPHLRDSGPHLACPDHRQPLDDHAGALLFRWCRTGLLPCQRER